MKGKAIIYLALALLFTVATCVQSSSSDDKIKDLIKSTGFIEIKLIEAQVPDLDPLPLQKDSDVFVRVYLNNTKELVCESQVVQDENKPKVSFCFLFFLYYLVAPNEILKNFLLHLATWKNISRHNSFKILNIESNIETQTRCNQVKRHLFCKTHKSYCLVAYLSLSISINLLLLLLLLGRLNFNSRARNTKFDYDVFNCSYL